MAAVSAGSPMDDPIRRVSTGDERIAVLRYLFMTTIAALTLASALLVGRQVTLLAGAALVSVMTLGCVYFVVNATFKSVSDGVLSVVRGALLLVLVSLISLLYNGATELSHWFAVIKTGMVLGFFLGLSTYHWGERDYLLFTVLWVPWLIAFVLMWIWNGFEWGYAGLMANSNGLGMFSFLSIFFPWMLYRTSTKKTRRILAAFSIMASKVLILASVTRSTWFALLFVVLTYLIWPFLIRNRRMYQIYFWVIVVVLLCGAYAYTELSSTDVGYEVNRWMHEHLGKNAFSGRQVLWPVLLEAVREQPLLGWGPGFDPTVLTVKFVGRKLSAHNVYLQTAVQMGLLGVMALLLFFYFIWRTLYYGKMDSVVRISGSALIGILVHENFEVYITQNALGVGLLSWVILAAGLYCAIERSREWSRIALKRVR